MTTASSPLQVGQEIRVGDFVGTVGSTGTSTGAHLHFEVRIDDIAIDRMLTLASEAAALLELAWPPKAQRKPICDTCSYRFLCGYA
jgi:murein DD-endopeptidase MepM/ murein hydrolase activator NlpD